MATTKEVDPRAVKTILNHTVLNPANRASILDPKDYFGLELIEKAAEEVDLLSRGEQAFYLQTVFFFLAQQGKGKIYNDVRKSSAVMINHQIERGFPHYDYNLVFREYAKAVRSQVPEANTIEGSIDTLLEIGQNLAPLLSLNPAKFEEILRSWEEVQRRFADNSRAAKFIEAKASYIKKIAEDHIEQTGKKKKKPQEANEEKTGKKRGRPIREADLIFYTQIQELLIRGLTRKQIVAELKTTTTRYDKARGYLKRNNLI